MIPGGLSIRIILSSQVIHSIANFENHWFRGCLSGEALLAPQKLDFLIVTVLLSPPTKSGQQFWPRTDPQELAPSHSLLPWFQHRCSHVVGIKKCCYCSYDPVLDPQDSVLQSVCLMWNIFALLFVCHPSPPDRKHPSLSQRWLHFLSEPYPQSSRANTGPVEHVVGPQ